MTTQSQGPRPSIFITGAASGIGRATAKLFANRGWFIGATDVSAAGLDTLRQESGADNIWTSALDVTDKNQLETTLGAFVSAAGGRLDVMFNNAGIGESGWFEDVPYGAALRVVQTNFIGVLNGAYAALPFLKTTPKSLMISTSSSSATYGMPRIAVYAATKFAVKGLTEALSAEWMRHGVRVADVLPGLIDTAILRSTPNRSGDAAARNDAELYANAPKSGPFRLIPPEQVAETVWAAYHGDQIHWYVPKEIGRIDQLKAFAPKMVRSRIMKAMPQLQKSDPPKS
ncbi:MAG TPA: short-chain dehydrogenase [Alphaproteobacteria bacterium]|nr:short-chain dehydrogenase [Alphaproteobacteria bacterium]